MILVGVRREGLGLVLFLCLAMVAEESKSKSHLAENKKEQEEAQPPLGLGAVSTYTQGSLPSFAKPSEGKQPWALRRKPFGVGTQTPSVLRPQVLGFDLQFASL